MATFFKNLQRTSSTVPKLLQQQKRTIRYLQASKNHDEAKLRVRNLYRRILQKIPWTKKIYFIDLSEKEMAKRIQREFRKNAHIQDLGVIDTLILKGELELEETVYHHKQKGHMQKWFAHEEPITTRPREYMDPFLQEFFAKDKLTLSKEEK